VRKSPSHRRPILRNKERKTEAALQQASSTGQSPIGAKDSQEQTGKIKRLSEIAGLVQSLLTIAGIIAAAIWFIAQSESSPKANITHSITHRKIHENWTWIHTTIEISNVGKRRLALRYGIARLHQILPLDISIHDKIQYGDPLISKDISMVKWPVLKDDDDVEIRSNIYPGETDKIYYEFVVPSFIGTVELYTFFSMKKNDPQGWSKITIYDLNKKGD
jgi:hypothetical protein